jgi:hypothetical protein
MTDIYKEYKKLEDKVFRLESHIYYLEMEVQDGNIFERVENKLKEQFGEEE